ncbi:isocitrate lyase/PEP mutase family protein [Arthrobacter sp. MI7-26]|uniref:isocitrate lyase/PEP mutase family protein n=1 Tax=Arthrobacter sp. MI7-26 TaxID=2993653 RepID=UPI0022499827|nr:isocitrate lyase/PEP mutase family protein [Arthrobacter sp. MI7-26]MCX2749819.1 isocitrate lyase/PEP mutase family protein [Arthrobacter sp. MI7-26]
MTEDVFWGSALTAVRRNGQYAADRASRRKSDTLAEMLDDDLVFAPGCFDCLSAAVLEGAGAQALFVSGAGLAASVAGLPDLGLLSLQEVTNAATNIVARSGLPVIVDGDNGFGNELNTARTVAAIGQLGAAAIMIEDQVFPKRCGHLAQKSVIDRRQFARKLKVALEICSEFNMLLIARTDSLSIGGIDEAMERSRMAHDLGAHLTFVDAPRDMADIEQIGGLPGHKMYNVASGSTTPSLPFRDLKDIGFGLIVDPAVSLYPVIDGIRKAFAAVVAEGSALPMTSFGMAPRDIFRAVGLDEWLDLENNVANDFRAVTSFSE